MASSFDSHMNFRMSARDKKIIETAAKLKGLKPNTYARQKLLEVAEKDIAEMSQMNTLILSDSDWKLFVEIMESPVKINKNLQNAIASFNKLKK
jgi:uncharacterized protein (DUF1778 family)